MNKKIRSILKDVELEPLQWEKISRIAVIEEKKEALDQELTETKEVRIEELQKEIETIVFSNPLLQIGDALTFVQNYVTSVTTGIGTIVSPATNIARATDAVAQQIIADIGLVQNIVLDSGSRAIASIERTVASATQIAINTKRTVSTIALRTTNTLRTTSIAFIDTVIESVPRLENIGKNIALKIRTQEETVEDLRNTFVHETQQSVSQSFDIMNSSIAAVHDSQQRKKDKRIGAMRNTAQQLEDASIIIGQNIGTATEHSMQIASNTVNAVGSGIHKTTNSIARSSIALQDIMYKTSNSAKENANYIAWQIGEEIMRPSAPAPELPEPKVYRTQVKQENNQFLIATLHMSIFDHIGEPMRNTPVVLFSEPKVSVTNNEGIATFHNVETGKHTLKIQIDDVTIKEQTLIIEPPSGINVEELEGIDIILPVMQILLDDPTHGAAPSTRGWAFIIIIASIIIGNAVMGYFAVFYIWKKRIK
ncbi:hypothetical protein HOK40_04595 [Candidatus Peregrinibacteria bacterium]|nr:hypothetical protein [Candidatus Peregrinibacteria bacterium]